MNTTSHQTNCMLRLFLFGPLVAFALALSVIGQARAEMMFVDPMFGTKWTPDIVRAIIWDLAQPNANQLLILRGDSKLIQARWTADGRDVITAWSNGNVKVWRGSTKEDIAMLQAGEDDFETMFRAWQMQYTNALTR